MYCRSAHFPKSEATCDFLGLAVQQTTALPRQFRWQSNTRRLILEILNLSLPRANSSEASTRISSARDRHCSLPLHLLLFLSSLRYQSKLVFFPPARTGTSRSHSYRFSMAPSATDGRNNDGIANYTKFWQKDSKHDTQTDMKNRLSEYTSVVNGYYDGATDLYEYGWGQNFHFARYYKGEAFMQAIARHEHYLAHQMALKPRMRVLDVGCGVGGPAREIARFADVNIVGLNNNEYQVQRARKYTEMAGLSGQVECKFRLSAAVSSSADLFCHLYSCQG